MGWKNKLCNFSLLLISLSFFKKLVRIFFRSFILNTCNCLLFSVYYTMSPQPAWVIFTEIVHTSKIHIKELTQIDPLWLEVLAPHYYEKVTLRS